MFSGRWNVSFNFFKLWQVKHITVNYFRPMLSVDVCICYYSFSFLTIRSGLFVQFYQQYRQRKLAKSKCHDGTYNLHVHCAKYAIKPNLSSAEAHNTLALLEYVFIRPFNPLAQQFYLLLL